MKKNTKRSLLLSVLALILCCALLAGTTLAWFTDTASSGVNKIQAGNLDVALEMQNANGTWVNAEGETLEFKKAAGAAQDEDVLWEPGCTYELPELRIVNNGNLHLKYKIVISGINGSAKLNKVIDWTMNNVSINSATEYSLAPNETSAPVVIKGHMQETAGNDYQGLSIDGVAITVYATQETAEFDSIDNQYDAGATYPVQIIPAVDAGMTPAAPNTDNKVESYSYSNSDNTLTATYKPTEPVDATAAAPKVVVKKAASDAGNVTIDTATKDAIAYDISLQDESGTVLQNRGTATFTLKVGTGLTGVTVYHNNVQMTSVNSASNLGVNEFYYNSSAGTVTFVTNSFSPFTIVFDSPVAVAGGVSYYDLQSALNAGGEVILLKNVDTPTITYHVQKDVTLNLNGKTVSGSGYDGTFCVDKAVTLTINGEGNVIGNVDQDYGMAVWVCADGAKAVINGGTYTNTLTDDAQMDMIYASNGGDIEINGGTFKCITPKWTLNIRDTNHADRSSTITVNGGKFYQYDPSNSTTENPVADFVASGKCALKNGDWYEIVEGTRVNDQAGLNQAIADKANKIYLGVGQFAIPELTDRNVTVIGCGDQTIVDVSGKKAYHGSTVTIKNCAVKAASDNYQGFQHINELIYQDCKVTGLQFLYGNKAKFVNCEFTSADDAYSQWTYGCSDVEYIGCKFNSANNSKSILCYNEGSVGTLKRTFTNCTFAANGTSEKSAVMINPTAYDNVSAYEVTFTNCSATGYAENGIPGQTIVGLKQTVKDTITVKIDGKVVYTNSAT